MHNTIQHHMSGGDKFTCYIRLRIYNLHCVPEKKRPFNFLNNCQKLTDLSDF